MDLKAVQTALIKRGFDLGPTGADGVLGRKTIEAVKAFQKAQNIAVMYPGTIGPRTLEALNLFHVVPSTEPPWIVEARRVIGLREKLDNKKLRDWLKSDCKTLGDPAKLPWCGDFVQTPLALTLPGEALPSNPYWALNWSKFGRDTDGLYLRGSVGTKKRNGGGHVFYIVGHDKTHVHALGGNQSDMVSIVRIPKSAVVAMRWPETYPMPSVSMPMTAFNGAISTKED